MLRMSIKILISALFSNFSKLILISEFFFSALKSLISPNFRIFKYIAFVRMSIDKPLF